MFTTLSTNFSGSLETGVDPRTGQFFVNLPLAEITGNYLTGPHLSLTARYSSLSDSNDSGLGKGISLGGVSFYNTVSRRLSLGSGESWPVDTSNTIPDRRLKDCIFSVTKENDVEFYKLNWKNGVTEYLSMIGGNVYATSRIISPIGKEIMFTWSWNGSSALLEGIRDKHSDLCRLQYTSGGVIMTLWPETSEESRLIFAIQDGKLSQIRKKVSESTWMEWKLNYSLVAPSHEQLLTSVAWPTGMTDDVSYQHNALAFPSGSGHQWLPAVQSYTRNYGCGQPSKTTRYTYTSNNFLGRNALSDVFGSWSKQSDYIYGMLTNDYTYGSTETMVADDDIISICRTYNNYHFLISTRTSRKGCDVVRETQYYAEIGKMSTSQPAQYILPSKHSETVQDQNKNIRIEDTITKFDEYGNPTYSESPDGTITKYEYYPAEGHEDCPPEPNGFVRFIKNKITEPRETAFEDLTHLTKYTYRRLGKNTNHVVQHTVSEHKNKLDVKLLTKEVISYDDEVESNTFGRITSIAHTKYENGENSTAFSSRQEFAFSVSNGVLIQEARFTGHDGITSTVNRRQSAYSGLLDSETSAHGLKTRYEYDSLGRVIRRIMCPESEYENSTTWEYYLDPNGPNSVETDAMGNKTKTVVDGAGRIIKRHTFDKETSRWYDIFSLGYNNFGEIIKGIMKDWLPGSTNNFSLHSDLSYGGWGEKNMVDYSDGRKLQQLMDPINLSHTVVRQGGTGNTNIRVGSVTTTLDNKSKLPVSKETKDSTDEEKIARTYKWDGLGRLREEQDELGVVTKRTYDEFGRMLTHTLPDGTIVHRSYAPHLTGNQVASISVTGSDSARNFRSWLLGTQTFDSLGRLTKSVSGGRITSYTYDGALSVPSTITLPSGKNETYTYIPELGNAVSSITVDGVTKTFTYDRKTGELLTAREADAVIENTWASKGLLKEEVFKHGEETRRSEYSYTLKGVLVNYKDVTGKHTRYTMDEYGRVTRIIDDKVTVDMSYDALGRPSSQTVRNTTSGSFLSTVLTYNDVGHEISRTVTNTKGIKLVLSQTWQKNGLLATRTTQINDAKLREEQYSYDCRNRLIIYSATGDSLPIDTYGHRIVGQTFTHDALNNLTYVKTTFSGGSVNEATYTCGNDNDPTQLTSITNTHTGYPQSIRLSYDSEGRLIRDEARRLLTYDAKGRLIGVDESNGKAGSYKYDAQDRLIAQNIGKNDSREFYYRGTELMNQVLKVQNRETRLIKTGHTCVSVNDDSDIVLMAGDRNDSLLWSESAANEGKLHVWSPYGKGTREDILPGFNGEREDPVSGAYHLGNGYRAYSSALMRFNCPDGMSPFGAGGINPYAYCSGDPVNHTDPSGHLSWQAKLGIALGVIGLAAAVFTAGMSIAAAGGIAAAISAASATSLIVGSVGVVSDVAAIASGATEESSPEVSSIMGWVSLGTGLLGAGIGIGKGVSSVLRSRSAEQVYDLTKFMWRNDSFFAHNGTGRTPKWYKLERNGKTIFAVDQEINTSHVHKIIDEITTASGNQPKTIKILSGSHGTWLGNNWRNGVRRPSLLDARFIDFDENVTRQVRSRSGNTHSIDVLDLANLTEDEVRMHLDNSSDDIVLTSCFGRNDSALRNILGLPPITPYIRNFQRELEAGYINLIDL